MRRGMVLVTVAAVAAAPVDAQTLFDTLRQLKTTVRSLGAVPSTAPARGAGTSGAPAAGGAVTDALVPDGVLTDDPSDTALERAPLDRRKVGTFDVRGFKLGMSPREAGRVAARQNFRRRLSDGLLTTGSFEVEATRIANHMLNRPIERTSKVQLMSTSAADPAGNSIICTFTPTPDGPKLSSIVYNARLDGATPAEAQAALVAKYGRPLRGGDAQGGSKWADNAAMFDLTSPTLISHVGDDGVRLDLEASSDWIKAQRDRLDARARQIAAAAGGGVRF